MSLFSSSKFKHHIRMSGWWDNNGRVERPLPAEGGERLEERHPPFFVTAPRDISPPFLRLLLSLGGRVGGRGDHLSHLFLLLLLPHNHREEGTKACHRYPSPPRSKREGGRLLSLLFLVGFNHAEKMPRLWEQFPRDVGFRGQFSETSSEGGERDFHAVKIS